MDLNKYLQDTAKMIRVKTYSRSNYAAMYQTIFKEQLEDENGIIQENLEEFCAMALFMMEKAPKVFNQWIRAQQGVRNE